MNKVFKLIKYLFPRTFEQLDQKRIRFKNRKPLKWASQRSTDADEFMKNIDKDLYEKTTIFRNNFKLKADNILSQLDTWQGGGGAYDLLYFLIMKTKPLIVVETGVASGWSSNSILSAFEDANTQKSHLFSSDLPYYNNEESKKTIGILIEEKYKKNLTLCIRGDEECLDKFQNDLKEVDLFHYDSEKSYEGRKFAWDKLNSKFSKNTIIIFDDIHNNFHFRDLVEELKVEYKIFKVQNKYVGIFVYGGEFKLNNFDEK
tara:strand:- start:2227 stop:3003 length:777 start_codon:yes stop_codon:yes gene_type:complete